MSCKTVNGQQCQTISNWGNCGLWQLSNDNINCYSSSLIAESLNIAGADVNVFKLLGVHEQSRLIKDLNGSSISNGDSKGFESNNAFTAYNTEWRSKQTGISVINNAFIGYDFGVKKLDNRRSRYGIEANERREITTIKIKQSSDERMRARKIRAERSDDNIKWYGVAIIETPNDSNLNEINFKYSAPSRYWRFKPIEMHSANACIRWGIRALELLEYEKTEVNNIQDRILLENKNRDYGSSINLKGYYEILTISSELTRFGIEIPDATYQIKIPFISCIGSLNRPLIIGDIVELPSETQYTTKMEPIKRYLEITDVTWDGNSYTPGWKPTMFLVTAKPAFASEETQDIFGSLADHVDSSGLVNNGKLQHEYNWQDLTEIEHTIKNQSNAEVSERGSETSNDIRRFSEEEIQIAKDEHVADLSKMNYNKNGLYIEDAIPPNGAEYTEGNAYPENPEDGDYHRLTYDNLDDEYPARLYKYSFAKQQWIYLETDKRFKYNEQKAFIKDYI